MLRTTLAWRRHSIATGSLALELLEGPPIQESDVAGFHVVSQVRAPLQLDVWVGPSVSLAWWRERVGAPAAVFGPEAPTTVCGRAARRQEVAVPEQTAVGLFATDNGTESREQRAPALVHVAIAGTSVAGNQPFVVSWTVEAAHRDKLRGDEAHFLASMQCAP
jgi:hypothetical protein